MWPVIRRNVRAPDRDVEGSPATPQLSHRRCCPPRHVAGGSATHNSTSWTHPLVTEWSAAPVHRRCLTDCHRQRWSDDCRIPRPVPGCDSALGRVSTTAPQAREIPRPAPDACSAGTLKWGGVVREERPRPTILLIVPERVELSPRAGPCPVRPRTYPDNGHRPAEDRTTDRYPLSTARAATILRSLRGSDAVSCRGSVQRPRPAPVPRPAPSARASRRTERRSSGSPRRA
jgi:hypothetical protein